jgi:hypothetical protein
MQMAMAFANWPDEQAFYHESWLALDVRRTVVLRTRSR